MSVMCVCVCGGIQTYRKQLCSDKHIVKKVKRCKPHACLNIEK